MGFTAIFNEPAMVWFIIGLVCAVAEFILPGLIIIFFGIGAWCSALLLLVLDVSIFFQILIFILCSTLSLVFLRKRVSFKKEYAKDATEDFIGKRARAQERFTKGEFGKVFFNGTSWKAETLSENIIKNGDYVKITGQDSLTLLVESLKTEE
ncbi:MAG: NfeD family protein [Deltaproteobacteria bacterium]|nr:NfeD family protein [Deltaproteobacteria bacterium]